MMAPKRPASASASTTAKKAKVSDDGALILPELMETTPLAKLFKAQADLFKLSGAAPDSKDGVVVYWMRCVQHPTEL